MRSNQKGGIGNVHTMLRRIIPKGTVLERYTQWIIRKAISMSTMPQEKTEWTYPYELETKTFCAEILEKLQLRYVAPDEVTLSPKLLK